MDRQDVSLVEQEVSGGETRAAVGQALCFYSFSATCQVQCHTNYPLIFGGEECSFLVISAWTGTGDVSAGFELTVLNSSAPKPTASSIQEHLQSLKDYGKLDWQHQGVQAFISEEKLISSFPKAMGAQERWERAAEGLAGNDAQLRQKSSEEAMAEPSWQATFLLLTALLIQDKCLGLQTEQGTYNP